MPPILFNADPSARLDPTILSIRIQPDEGFSLGINSKVPGPHVQIYPVKMDFHYGSTFGGTSPEAYERLLLDVIAGDATLFMREFSLSLFLYTPASEPVGPLLYYLWLDGRTGAVGALGVLVSIISAALVLVAHRYSRVER